MPCESNTNLPEFEEFRFANAKRKNGLLLINSSKSCNPRAKSQHTSNLPIPASIVNNSTMKTSTKMYLSVVLSTACIMFYQYQLSKASLMSITGSSNNVNSIDNEVATLSTHNKQMHTNAQLSMQKLVTVVGNSTSSTTTTTSATNLHHTTSTDKTILPPPPLYIITPTYRRPEQLAEITRLGYTLKHVPNIFWLVIEDAVKQTPLVTNQLKRIGIPFEHLVAPMPSKYKKKLVKPRGVSNRNRGLEWIRKNATEGVFYFADDDNTYDLEIFNQMRYTKKVSMWPVGLVTKFGVSSPIIRDGKLSGFYDGWIGGRKYPIDMAGFAVNVQFFLSRPKAIMPYDAGYEEDKFLRSLAPLNNSEIELLASDCTEILTWHTQTKKNPLAATLDMHKYNGTNLVKLRKIIV